MLVLFALAFLSLPDSFLFSSSCFSTNLLHLVSDCSTSFSLPASSLSLIHTLSFFSFYPLVRRLISKKNVVCLAVVCVNIRRRGPRRNNNQPRRDHPDSGVADDDLSESSARSHNSQQLAKTRNGIKSKSSISKLRSNESTLATYSHFVRENTLGNSPESSSSSFSSLSITEIR